jgi:hypothetical protein
VGGSGGSQVVNQEVGYTPVLTSQHKVDIETHLWPALFPVSGGMFRA